MLDVRQPSRVHAKMRQLTIRARFALVLLAVAVACGGDKSPVPPSRVITGPPLLTVTMSVSSFTVQGWPATLAPGQTAQVTAIARFTDGSERDVSAETTWTSTQTQFASVERGLITARGAGRTVIRATYSSRSASTNLLVKPAGTFILTGRVTEPGPVNVEKASVAAVGSSSSPVVTNSVGLYELIGVVGTFTLRISKPGYIDRTMTLTVTGDQTLDVEIRPAVSPATLSGTYDVTLTISPTCNNVPSEYKTRTYTAIIQQTGARFRVELRDAEFVKQTSPAGEKNFIDGTVTEGTATFNFNDSYYASYYGGSVQEVLPAGQTLAFWGRMIAQPGATMSGNLVGGVIFTQAGRSRACSGSDNRLAFMRR